MHGISTRSVDELVKALGMTGISKSQVSRLCVEINERVRTFLERPIEGDWPKSLDRRHLREGARSRPDRLGRGDHRGRGQHRRPPRGAHAGRSGRRVVSAFIATAHDPSSSLM
jgi:hypothetical protein